MKTKYLEVATLAQINEWEAQGYEVAVGKLADEIAPDVPDTPGGPYPLKPEQTGGPTPPLPAPTWGFNPAQLITWADARALAERLGAFVGGGVLPETGDPKTSGLYVPEWLMGPANHPEPHDPETGAFFIHFRFRNGAEGMNAGLIADRFRRYPNAPLYVLQELATEAAMLARDQH